MNWRLIGWSALASIALFVLLGGQAWADNCGSLPDCWQTAAAAAAAAAGAGAAAAVAGRVSEDDEECDVERLTPITDLKALRMEDGDRLQWEGTIEGLRDAAGRLVAEIKAAGGTANVTSAWRPQAYQDHLREIWDKARALEARGSGGCDAVRAEVFAELNAHHLRTDQPVGTHSHHTDGWAVDMSWRLPGGDAAIDALAAECGLTHPIKNDRPHFELQHR